MDIMELQQPILDDGLLSTNFFNGRLLTAKDLLREQEVNRKVDRQLGQAIGEGIAYGLEVSPSETSKLLAPVLQITAGLAINRTGQILSLSRQAELSLTRQAKTVAGGSDFFAECQPIQTGTYIAGQGVYLLTMAPAKGRAGRAMTSGLGNEAASCNTDTVIETVQFRLIQIDQLLTDGELQDEKQLRNRLAYCCFGVKETSAFASDPFGPPLQSYGLIDKLRASVLSDCDVPLAVLYWTTSGGIEFVDMWAVRRRLTKRVTTDRWASLTDDRRASEGEAMFLQFQDHIESLRVGEANPELLLAINYFRYLPPVGFLPVQGKKLKGFSVNVFFANLFHRHEPEFIDSAQLQALLRDVRADEPIDPQKSEMIWLYKLWQTEKAAVETSPLQPYVIFAQARVPYQATARFDVARWGYSNYARCENCV